MSPGFQDELSGAGRAESTSSTAKSAAASDVAMASGSDRNLDSSRAKPDSRKNIGVQDAEASETSTGDSAHSPYDALLPLHASLRASKGPEIFKCLQFKI